MGSMMDDLMEGARVLRATCRIFKKTVKTAGRVITSEPVRRTARELKEKTKALAEQAGETLQQRMSQDQAELSRRQTGKPQAKAGSRRADKRQACVAVQQDDADEWQLYFSDLDDFYA